MEVESEEMMFYQKFQIQIPLWKKLQVKLHVILLYCMKTSRATLHEQNETLGGSIYWEPHVQGIPIPVEGTYYDTVDEVIDMYTKYAEMRDKIGATHAHNLLSSMKSGYEYVHGTTDDFKNHQRDVNVFIGCETVIIRDKKPNDNISLNTKKGKEQEKKSGTVAETVRDHKQYILRRWTRNIIPPDLRRQRNRYGKKYVTTERLTNEANFLTDDCLFLLSKDEGKMGTFVEKLKVLMEEVKVDVSNPPSRNTGDVIGCIFLISKPNQIIIQNLTKAVNKGEHLKKGERLKSEREKALKVRAKKLKIVATVKRRQTNIPKQLVHRIQRQRKRRRRHQLLMFDHFFVT
nr:hypothetical protein [Tanacetum cinerariifolium]